MTDSAENERAVIGNNSGEFDPFLDILEDLKKACEPFRTRGDKILSIREAFKARGPLQNADQAGKATQLIKDLRTLRANIDDIAAEKKKVITRAKTLFERTVELWTGNLLDFENEAREKLRIWDKQQLERQAQDQMRAESQAASLREEGSSEAAIQAQELEQAAIAPVATRTRSDHGAVNSARRVWKFRKVNEAAIPREYCTPEDKLIRAKMKLLEADLKAAVAALPEDQRLNPVIKTLIPGVEFYLDVSSRIA